MMRFNRKGLTDTQLLDFYKALLKPRLIEDKMLIALRQGKISKWFSAYGQEAVSVGAALAMQPNEFLLPMHRNLGMFTVRQVPLQRLFSQFLGKANGFTQGRDRSFHFGSAEHHLVGMISHLGPQMGIADGIALAHKLNQDEKITLVVTGDGGASEGDFHEAINVASVWNLPVIFLVENNQWGLSTPSKEQFNFKSFVYKAIGYGIRGNSVDGNNILEVYRAVQNIREKMQAQPGPFLLECRTFRMRGHEEASGTKYYPQGLQDHWTKKDPVTNFRAFLMEKEILSPNINEKMIAELKDEINTALQEALREPKLQYDPDKELGDRFASFTPIVKKPSGKAPERRMVDAIAEALDQSMEKHPKLVLMGQDIADYGGVFKITEGLMEKYGRERVRNTPLCESAIVGAALGLSIEGYKAMMEMQFSDFATEGFNQIINNLAKIHWRWGQNADVVIRMPTGGGVAAGPFHSQSTEAWFTHTPGLKVVYPAFAHDAKGLLLHALEDPNPVLYFEHKALYRSVKDPVPEQYYLTPFGKASLLREGRSLSIITYGAGVHWSLEYLDKNPKISADVLDLRSLQPLDEEAIYTSVKKTGRVIILQEDVLFGGIASDIAALVSEHCFTYLDAPVKRVGSADTPVPFAAELEQGFLAKSRLAQAVEETMAF